MKSTLSEIEMLSSGPASGSVKRGTQNLEVVLLKP